MKVIIVQRGHESTYQEFTDTINSEIKKIENMTYKPGDGCIYEAYVIDIKYISDREGVIQVALIHYQEAQNGRAR